MNLSQVLAFSSTAFAVALAVLVGLDGRRSVARLAFIGGMLALAGETMFARFSVSTMLAEAALDWQKLRLIVLGLLPGTWMLFSLGYSRGNAREALRKWWPIIA